LRKKHQPAEEEGNKVPAYIVTFSDMTTLLLTFFVMLLSLASMQEPELIGRGRDSFTFSLKHLGLGLLLGRKPRPDFGSIKIKYFIKQPDESFRGRSIHAREEEIRRTFNELNQYMKAVPSDVSAKKTDFSVTNIRFARGDTRLDESAKQFLSSFCLNLRQDPGSKPVKLYVLGLAGDQADEKEQWMISAKRAKAVADYVRSILSPVSDSQTQDGGWSKWFVYWWGAGPGGDWVKRDSPISKQTQILIAVLRADD
jgi:outer membrane protein OmpA-like peptidoglycan-associated protein